jgi:hypothetical protein
MLVFARQAFWFCVYVMPQWRQTDTPGTGLPSLDR